MTAQPVAPWRLAGEVLTARVSLPEERRLAPPEGVTARGASAVLWCGHWAQTPVGPFSELVLAVPARIGPRLGLSVVLNIVTSVDARIAGQLNWGFPRRLGTLRWVAVDRARRLHWEEGDVSIEAATAAAGRPYLADFRALQRRGDRAVIVPIRVVGWARGAAINLEAPEDSPFAPVCGEMKGHLVGGRQVMLQPARHPFGAWRSLSAPLRPPEPGWSPG